PIIRLRVPSISAQEEDLRPVVVSQLVLREPHTLAHRQEHAPLHRTGFPAHPPPPRVSQCLGLVRRPDRAFLAGLEVPLEEVIQRLRGVPDDHPAQVQRTGLRPREIPPIELAVVHGVSSVLRNHCCYTVEPTGSDGASPWRDEKLALTD